MPCLVTKWTHKYRTEAATYQLGCSRRNPLRSWSSNTFGYCQRFCFTVTTIKNSCKLLVRNSQFWLQNRSDPTGFQKSLWSSICTLNIFLLSICSSGANSPSINSPRLRVKTKTQESNFSWLTVQRWTPPHLSLSFWYSHFSGGSIWPSPLLSGEGKGTQSQTAMHRLQLYEPQIVILDGQASIFIFNKLAEVCGFLTQKK